MSLGLLLSMGACTKENKDDGKDYSLSPSGLPVRQPDLVAYLKSTNTEEERKQLLKEVAEMDLPRQASSVTPEVFEIWFTPDVTEDDKEELRTFLKSSPLVERIEET